MTLEKLSLTLNPSGSAEEYWIYPIQSVEIQSRKDAFSIAPPGLAASENILLGVSGMQADITIQATIWDDGTDRARGTHSSTVETVTEQITYLEDTIHAPDFSASWQLNHETGAAFADDDVFVERIEPTVIDQSSQKWKSLRIGLRRGSSV